MDFTKSLMVIAVLAVVVSGTGLLITSNKLSGFATTTPGNASLTVIGMASINFTNYVVNWSMGSVNESGSNGQQCGTVRAATLTTTGTLNCSNDLGLGNNWTNMTRGLVVENIGNRNVILSLVSSAAASAFIGGNDPVAPLFRWKLNQVSTDDMIGDVDGESGSCSGTLADQVWTDVATGTARQVCDVFNNYASSPTTNEIEIDLLVLIPANAQAGEKRAIITATATPI